MASQNVLDGVAALITIGAALVSWSHYYPATPMLARLGIPGPRANSGRSCGPMRLAHSWGITPTRNVVCRSRSFAAYGGPDTGFWLIQEVNLDALTRRVTHARRDLISADSAAWAIERDSIQSEMLKAGGEPIPCYAPWGEWPEWIKSSDAWRLSGYSIRLNAYHWVPGWQVPRGPSWRLQIDGYPDDPPGCGPGGVPHIRLPEPEPRLYSGPATLHIIITRVDRQ